MEALKKRRERKDYARRVAATLISHLIGDSFPQGKPLERSGVSVMYLMPLTTGEVARAVASDGEGEEETLHQKTLSVS